MEQRSLMLPATARLVAVADTHGRPDPAIGRRLEELRPDAILHAGDIGDAAVLDTLAAYAPVLAVRGNIDARGLPDELLVEVRSPSIGELRILLVHVAVHGPRLRADVERLARGAGASLVVCGHSHVPFIASERGITVFNPGSIGPRRFTLPVVLGTIELSSAGVRLGHVDGHTGAAWRPPERVGARAS